MVPLQCGPYRAPGNRVGEPASRTRSMISSCASRSPTRPLHHAGDVEASQVLAGYSSHTAIAGASRRAFSVAVARWANWV